jgi:hypothetical protein
VKNLSIDVQTSSILIRNAVKRAICGFQETSHPNLARDRTPSQRLFFQNTGKVALQWLKMMLGYNYYYYRAFLISPRIMLFLTLWGDCDELYFIFIFTLC